MSKYAPHKPSASNPRPTQQTLCQKCLKRGHFTYQCKGERPYVSRPSRTQMLRNPKLSEKFKPEVEVPEEFKNKFGTANKILEAKEKERAAENGKESKKRKRSGSDSGGSERWHNSGSSSSDSSSSESDSDSSSSRSVSSGPSSRSRSTVRRTRRHSSSRSRSRSHSSDEDEDRR